MSLHKLSCCIVITYFLTFVQTQPIFNSGSVQNNSTADADNEVDSNEHFKKLETCPFNRTAYDEDEKVKGLPVTKYCSEENGHDLLELEWDKPNTNPDVKYYIVRLIKHKDLRPYCINFNVTEEGRKHRRLTFTKNDGFEKDKEYWVSVNPYPGDYDNNPLKLIMDRITSCPWKGVWSSWGNWNCADSAGECNANGKSKSTKTRTRDCFNSNGVMLSGHECNGKNNYFETDPCFVNCSTTTTTATASTTPVYGENTSNNSQITTSIGALFGVLAGCIIVAAILYGTMKRRRRVPQSPIAVTEKALVYVSHAANLPPEETRILNLVHFISTYGIRSTLDLLCQVDINSCGGLPNWIPKTISDADKILVVLSKAYKEALNSSQEKRDEIMSERVCKINTEYNLIKKKIYHSCQLKPQLVILLENDMKIEDIPKDFCGRPFCTYPKNLNGEDENCHQLLGLLLNMEPIQLPAESPDPNGNTVV